MDDPDYSHTDPPNASAYYLPATFALSDVTASAPSLQPLAFPTLLPGHSQPIYIGTFSGPLPATATTSAFVDEPQHIAPPDLPLPTTRVAATPFNEPVPMSPAGHLRLSQPLPPPVFAAAVTTAPPAPYGVAYGPPGRGDGAALARAGPGLPRVTGSSLPPPASSPSLQPPDKPSCTASAGAVGRSGSDPASGGARQQSDRPVGAGLRVVPPSRPVVGPMPTTGGPPAVPVLGGGADRLTQPRTLDAGFGASAGSGAEAAAATTSRVVSPHRNGERPGVEQDGVASLLRFACETCGKRFPFASSLRRHEATHSTARPFECHVPGCGRAFKDRSNLAAHLRLHDSAAVASDPSPAEEPPLPPPTAQGTASGQTAAPGAGLRADASAGGPVVSSAGAGGAGRGGLARAGGPRGGGHECTVCHRRFSRKTHLQVHARTHTGEKPFVCPEPGCGRAYAHDSSLAVHMRTHTGSRPFKCEHPGCGRAFASTSSLASHTRTHTGEKPFKCTHPGCGRTFARRGNLTKHLKRHAGVRDYLCPFPGCGAAFSDASNLHAHKRVHTADRPFRCAHPGCGRAFKHATNLRRHAATHAPSQPAPASVPLPGNVATSVASAPASEPGPTGANGGAYDQDSVGVGGDGGRTGVPRFAGPASGLDAHGRLSPPGPDGPPAQKRHRYSTRHQPATTALFRSSTATATAAATENEEGDTADTGAVGEVFQCVYCGLAFADEAYRDRHLRSKHVSELPAADVARLARVNREALAPAPAVPAQAPTSLREQLRGAGLSGSPADDGRMSPPPPPTTDAGAPPPPPPPPAPGPPTVGHVTVDAPLGLAPPLPGHPPLVGGGQTQG